MGDEDFYVYDGRVKELPSTVKEYVFNDFNLAQREKAVAALNSSFNEVWWFYPSSSSDTVDRYVVYNYQSNIWYYGTLARTAWIDRGINTLPIAASTDGYLYFQEAGLNDGSTTPPSPIEAYIESSQVDIDDGDSFSFIRRIIPDVTFNGSSASAPTVGHDFKSPKLPGGKLPNYRYSGCDSYSNSSC
jgi:hypothetical protein